MKFDYSVTRDPQLEYSALMQPYLFSTFSFEIINSFLAGSGIFFQDEPLSERMALRFAQMVSSYAVGSESCVGSPELLIRYEKTISAKYTWGPRMHSLFLSAKGEINRLPGFLGDSVMTSPDIPEISFITDKNENVKFIAGTNTATFLKKIFCPKQSRINIEVKYESLASSD